MPLLLQTTYCSPKSQSMTYLLPKCPLGSGRESSEVSQGWRKQDSLWESHGGWEWLVWGHLLPSGCPQPEGTPRELGCLCTCASKGPPASPCLSPHWGLKPLHSLLGLVTRRDTPRQPGASCPPSASAAGMLFPSKPAPQKFCHCGWHRRLHHTVSYRVPLPQKAPFVWISVNNSGRRHNVIPGFGAVEFIMITGKSWMWQLECLESPLNSMESNAFWTKSKAISLFSVLSLGTCRPRMTPANPLCKY